MQPNELAVADRSVTVDLSEVLALVNRDLPQPEQINYEVTRDGVRHVAYAMEDYNALYLDAEYARETRWGGIIAPPGYLYSHANTGSWVRGLGTIRDSSGLDFDLRDNMGDEWEFFVPARPGDVIIAHARLTGAVLKRGPRMGLFVLVVGEVRYVNQRGEVVAICRGTTARWSAQRQRELGQMGGALNAHRPAPSAGEQRTTHARTGEWITPYGVLPPAPPRRYDRHHVFAEDLAVGTQIPPLRIGPLTTVHTRRWESIAMWLFRGEDGGSIVSGGHVANFYAAGVMRIPWFGTMLSAWLGPNAWIRKLGHRNREWVLVGKTYWARGEVRRTYVEDGRHYAECVLRLETDEGVVTNTGEATVELPTRSTGR